MEEKPYTPGGGHEQPQLCHTRDITAGVQGSRRKSGLRTQSCVYRVTFSSKRASQVSLFRLHRPWPESRVLHRAGH